DVEAAPDEPGRGAEGRGEAVEEVGEQDQYREDDAHECLPRERLVDRVALLRWKEGDPHDGAERDERGGGPRRGGASSAPVLPDAGDREQEEDQRIGVRQETRERAHR